MNAALHKRLVPGVVVAGKILCMLLVTHSVFVHSQMFRRTVDQQLALTGKTISTFFAQEHWHLAGLGQAWASGHDPAKLWEMAGSNFSSYGIYLPEGELITGSEQVPRLLRDFNGLAPGAKALVVDEGQLKMVVRTDFALVLGTMPLVELQLLLAELPTGTRQVVLLFPQGHVLAPPGEEALPPLMGDLTAGTKIKLAGQYIYIDNLPGTNLLVGLVVDQREYFLTLLRPALILGIAWLATLLLFVVYSRLLRKNVRVEFLLAHMAQFQALENLTTMGKMAAGLAHEVKNPLSVIDGYIQLMDAFPEKYATKGTLQLVKHELAKIIDVLRDYLTLGKPMTAISGRVDINKVLQALVTLMELYAFKKDIRFITDYANSLPLVRAEEDKLRQIFVNLLKNAIEAMDNGGEVAVATQHTKSGIRVKISDTGCGIAPEHLKLLGTPFFTTKPSGTGMGLAMTYQLVQDLGGCIDVSSKLGQGTTFWVELPAER